MSSPIYMSACLDCKNRVRDSVPKDVAFCKAYPDGIPYEVWIEKSKPSADKNAPCPNGYKFEHLKANGERSRR